MKRNIQWGIRIKFNYIKMKTNFLKIFFAASLILLVSSCSKDSDDHNDHTDCHECHIAFVYPDGSEDAWEITAPGGGDEFCGDDLEDAESTSYVYVVSNILVNDDGDTLLPGNYGAGSENPQYEVHCEDHANHDH